jgi:hypothetical protein
MLDSMARHEEYEQQRCTACGWPLGERETVVSRHRVAAGVIRYARCVCGRLRVWLDPERTDPHRAAAVTGLVVEGRGQAPARTGRPADAHARDHAVRRR